MRGDGLRGVRSNRGGGRYRRGGLSSYHGYHHHGYNVERRDHLDSGDDEVPGKESHERHEFKPRARDGSRAFSEDSRISKQLRRLSREENAERFLELIQQLEDTVVMNENIKYVRRNADHILECLFENFHSAPSRPCKWEVAHCIGQVGHVMDNDVERFVHLSLSRLEIWKHTELKVLVLKGIYYLLDFDASGHQLNIIGDPLVEGLHSVLEGTETVEVMVATVDILRKIYSANPSIISPYFEDIVDILIGWHIDYSQPVEVTNYVSLSLQSFTELWLRNISFSNTLLTQFVEDMEDYVDEPTNEETDPSNEDGSYEWTCNAKKVASFIGVFTTTLRCLGIQADPSLNTQLSATFHIDSLRKMIVGAEKLLKHQLEDAILNALNQLCIVLLPLNIEGLLGEILKLVSLHRDCIQQMNYASQLSFLCLLKQTIQQLGSSLPVSMVQDLLCERSSLVKLRMSPHQEVWSQTLAVYHALLALKNVPLLQEAYKLILRDIQAALKVLVPDAPLIPLPSPVKEHAEGSMTSYEASVMLSYYIAVLAEVANTRNSIISMWALSPSLVDLLANHLSVSSPHLASHYPEVQQNILFLLYSHSAKHTHYISSSSMVVGSSSVFVSSSVVGGFTSEAPTFSSSSSTSGNLSTILNTVTAVLKLRKVASAQVLQLCIKWATEIIIGCESSLLQLLQKQPFKTLISALVDLGYHFLESVSLCVARCISDILNVLPFSQLHCLEDIVHLSLYHSSHKNNDIRKFHLEILARLPLSVVVSIKPNTKREYSSGKGDIYDTLELGNIDHQTIMSLQRQYLLHSSAAIPPTAFHAIISFLLKSSIPGDERWLEDLFRINERVERMSKPEDWSFSVLAPQLQVLLWKWMVFESSLHCVANKLRTTLGKPHDTFTTIETVIKQHAKEVRECGLDPSRNVTPSSTEDKSKSRLSPQSCYRSDLLPVVLLMEFVECLEKAMFNASDGCAVVPHPSNKSVRIFFTTNRQTCVEWLTRIRAAVITVALNSGQPHVALRHSHKLLKELIDNNNHQGGDFERALCYCVKSLIAVGCEEAVIGLYYWAKSKTGRRFPWVKMAAFSAGKRYEMALKGYLPLLDENIANEGTTTPDLDEGGSDQGTPLVITPSSSQNSTDPFVKEFIQFESAQCYWNLNKWEKLFALGEGLLAKSGTDPTAQKSGDLNRLRDLSYIQALAYFHEENLEGLMTVLSDVKTRSSCPFKASKEWPLWKKSQAIELNLLQSFAMNLFSLKGADYKELDSTIYEMEKELEWLLQVAPLNPQASPHITGILNLQLLHQLKNFRNQKRTDSHLHENWEAVPLDSVPFDLLQKVSTWTKLIANMQQNVSEAAITKLDLLCVKFARKKENFEFAETSLIKLLKRKNATSSDSLEKVVVEFSSESEFTILTSKLNREAAKLLACTGRVTEGCNVLANIVTYLNPVLAALANQDPSLLSLPPNEAGHICSRSLLTLNKWWGMKNKRNALLPNTEDESIPIWMQKTVKVYQQMKAFVPDALKDLTDLSHPALPQMEVNMGNLLTLAAIQCPNLPKVWYQMASWAFKWGRHILSKGEEEASLLHAEDVEAIRVVLTPVLPPDTLQLRLQDVASLLGSSRRREEVREEEEEEEDVLRLEEVEGSQQLGAALSHMFLEWGLEGNLISGLVSSLLKIRCSALRRNHSVLTTSAKAYFRFLKIGHVNSSHSDQQMIATLRLLRLIVKHASELQDVLEKGLSETPTAPWRAIIPQLFARLNHPEPYVRGSISDLLCRLAKDCPHLIIFPAVVGSSGAMATSNQASFTDMFAKYFNNNNKKKKRRKSEAAAVVSVEGAEGEEVPDDEKEGRSSSSDEDEEEEEEEEEEREEEEAVEEEKHVDEFEEEEEEDKLLSSSKDQEKRTLMQNCFSTLVNTLKKQVGGSISEVQTLIYELRRITILWDELWLGTLTQHHSELTKKCGQLKADIARLSRNPSLTNEEKNQLIRKKYDIVFQPMVFVLDQLIEITSASPETPHEKTFQESFKDLIESARQDLVAPPDYQEPMEAIAKLKNLHQILQQKSQKRSATNLKMAEISPVLSKLTNTKIAMPGVNSPFNEIVSIASVGSTIMILPTKTKPKKLSFQGSDGKRYTYLFKGLEDLHLDQRIMQFLATVNTMLSKDHRSCQTMYRAHYYSVVPLGARSGLIQWVGSATPLFGLYKRWQQREAQLQSMKTHSTHPTAAGAPLPLQNILRPSDLYYSKLSSRLKEAGVSIENRKEWPIAILRDVFEELVKETPADLLSRELWQTSINASEWWRITHMYNISTAVMSIIGYVIGLGDRHLDNLLVNLTSGEVVHIDYNVCFEKGKNLRVPEKVPYRMTQNIEAALGVTGVEGIFRSACEHVLRTMRRGRETLLTLLEAFIYDPLVDWTPDSEAGYAGAVYGGDQALVLEARQNRQQLERALTVSMFTVKLTEMKTEWLHNKDNVLESIPIILNSLEKWQATNQTLAQAEGNLQEGHHLMAMIKEAEANPQHSLYGLLERHKEFTIVKTSIHTANELLLTKINELKGFQNQYKMADKMFKGGYINDLRSKLLSIGPLISSVAPVMEYIATAGQSQLATQCEHTEMDLRHSLAQVVTLCMNALEPLSKYGSVWVNYPSDHIENHRISKHLAALQALYNNLTLENVQLIITKSHKEMSEDSVMETRVCNIDIQLHSKTLQLNAQLQKIYEHLQEEGLNNGTAIVSAYQESLSSLTTLAVEQGELGSSAVVCALLNSLSQTLSMRLREDKAVASMGENLADMMIGNIWWFSESMVSHSTIWELVSLLNKYSPPSLPSESAVFKAMSLLMDVFNAIQDLILNTSQIIVVEGGRLLWIKEPSVINIASRLQDVVDNCSTSLRTLCQHLTHHLHMTIFRMPSVYENSVQEANLLHTQLVTLIQQMTDTSFSTSDGGVSGAGSEMSQGQMLLMGFHLLFETVDSQLDRLIDALSAAPLPHPWPRVDMIKLSTEIMGPLFDPSLREVVRAILRVKKVQAITDFFSQALQMFTEPGRKSNAGLSGSEEEQLAKVVRSYAGECIFRLLLGLPSYLSTHMILIHAQKLGVDVTGYIESHDVGTEGRVPLEGLVEEALEKCITQKSLQSVIATAASTVNNHMTAVRRKLLLRQWESEVEGAKVLLQRVSFQHVSLHWYYEEMLKQRVHSLQLPPNRSAIVGELRKLENTFLALNQNISELKERFTNLTGNVMHRLKWAAGSNPSIAQALEEFSKNVDAASTTLSKVIRASEEIRSLCKGVCHYENLKMTSVEALTEDNNFTTVLNKTQESCMVIQRYTGTISSQEELLLMLCSLPEEISPAWVQLSATAVSEHLASLTLIVSEQSSTLKVTEEDVRASVDQLRVYLAVHHKLMSDVRVLLKSLAKFEQEGGLQGVDGYLCLYKRYSEIMSGVVRQILHEPLSPDKINLLTQKLQQLLLQTYVIYDKLVEFGSQCMVEERNQEGSKSLLSKDPQMSTLSLKDSSIFSTSRKVAISDVSSARTKRHPVTGKVIQEHNQYALGVWQRVKLKLEGKDPNSSKVISVNEQVDSTIKEACNINNLATLYEGWTPWV